MRRRMELSLAQIVVMWIGILAAAAMITLPPWGYPTEGGAWRNKGYHFIGRSLSEFSQIDTRRLALQLGIVALVVGGMLITIRPKARD